MLFLWDTHVSFTHRYRTQIYQEAHLLQTTPRHFFIYFSVLNHSFSPSPFFNYHYHRLKHPKDTCHHSHCDQSQCQKIQIINDSCHQQSKIIFIPKFSEKSILEQLETAIYCDPVIRAIIRAIVRATKPLMFESSVLLLQRSILEPSLQPMSHHCLRSHCLRSYNYQSHLCC